MLYEAPPAEARPACTYADVDLFFSDEPEDQAKAKEMCRGHGGCPQRAWCLAQAIDRNESGIWGGFTDTERGLYVAIYGRAIVGPVQELPVTLYVKAGHRKVAAGAR